MLDDMSQYVWLVAVAGVVAFIMAFGIGANDVANAFGPSVGAKALKLWQAVIVAAIFEFGGSVLMGGAVMDTIAKGIADADMYAEIPEVLMLGMLTALIGAGLWLLIATALALPVSTTHSIIGAIIGFSLCALGPDSIKWNEMGLIVASWFVSPVLAGLMAAGVFYLVRRFVLRPDNSLQRGFIFYPLLISITISVNVFFILYKGPVKGMEEIIPYWQGVLIALGGGVVIALLLHFLAIPFLRKRIESADFNEVTPLNVDQADYETIPDAESGKLEPSESKSGMSSFFASTMGRDIHAEALEKSEVADIHRNAEVFDPRTEHLFSFLQVATACFASFAHGSNDVANSVAPFAVVFYIYTNNAIPPEDYTPEIWILCMGGAGIVIGLAMYGWKVIKTLGTELIKMTSSRGFAIELSAAFVVVTATMIGIPISSTHCQVGATVSVGALEGRSGFNAKLFLKTFGAWMFTIFFAGLVSASLFSFAYFSPSKSFPPPTNSTTPSTFTLTF